MPGIKKITKAIAYAVASIFLVCLLFVWAFHFAYWEVPYQNVYIQQVGADKYEVTFMYKAKVWGNMHEIFSPLTISTADEADWFYIAKDSGTIDAGDIIFTHFRNCKDSLYWQKALKGSVTIDPQTINFNLEIPSYALPSGQTSNTVQGYRNWQNNGQYHLVRGSPPLVPSNAGGYRPDSCD